MAGVLNIIKSLASQTDYSVCSNAGGTDKLWSDNSSGTDTAGAYIEKYVLSVT